MNPRPIDPTPEEIAEACRQIRNEWDDSEYYRRAGYTQGVGWLPPEARVMLRVDGDDDDYLRRAS